MARQTHLDHGAGAGSRRRLQSGYAGHRLLVEHPDTADRAARVRGQDLLELWGSFVGDDV